MQVEIFTKIIARQSIKNIRNMLIKINSIGFEGSEEVFYFWDCGPCIAQVFTDMKCLGIILC